MEEILEIKPRFVTSMRFHGTWRMCLCACLVRSAGTCKLNGLASVIVKRLWKCLYKNKQSLTSLLCFSVGSMYKSQRSMYSKLTELALRVVRFLCMKLRKRYWTLVNPMSLVSRDRIKYYCTVLQMGSN